MVRPPQSILAPGVNCGRRLRTRLVDDLVGLRHLDRMDVFRTGANPNRDNPMAGPRLLAHGKDRPGHDQACYRLISPLVAHLRLCGPVAIDTSNRKVVSPAADKAGQPCPCVPGRHIELYPSG